MNNNLYAASGTQLNNLVFKLTDAWVNIGWVAHFSSENSVRTCIEVLPGESGRTQFMLPGDEFTELPAGEDKHFFFQRTFPAGETRIIGRYFQGRMIITKVPAIRFAPAAADEEFKKRCVSLLNNMESSELEAYQIFKCSVKSDSDAAACLGALELTDPERSGILFVSENGADFSLAEKLEAFFQIIITDPRFAKLGMIGFADDFSSCAAMNNRCAALLRHYALQGKTDLLEESTPEYKNFGANSLWPQEKAVVMDSVPVQAPRNPHLVGHNGMRNVRDYGAVGDGITNDTAAIQRALDDGGGVFLPGGTYRCGTLYLRSHGGLELASDAVIQASDDPADYNGPDDWPQNWGSVEEKASGAHLIVALECENVFLRGYGRIDGSREKFFIPGGDASSASWAEFNGWRPSQMLYFCECRLVRINDLTLTNSPYWSCFIFGCDNVRISGLTISNLPRESWNGDGIDIDCSTNVRVSDCLIRSADDCLTVRASKGYLKLRYHKDQICENVVVTNCIMMNGHAAVRFGVGTGKIRNCTVSNCVVKDTRYGIGIHSSFAPSIRNKSVPGCDVENLLIDNMDMSCGAPFFITVNSHHGIGDVSTSYIRGIIISNCRFRSVWNGLIEGNRDYNLTDLQFNNVSFEMSGGDEILYPLDDDMRVSYRSHRYPAAVAMRYVRDCRFRNVTVRWRDESEKYRCALWMKKCEETDIMDCRLTPPRNGREIIEEQ
ncbi:MAG: hypothetical protein E7048_09450 [Lentisphaerae bacterium]|nr:hypothetical protein [Lentisphaerota bacterium]